MPQGLRAPASPKSQRGSNRSPVAPHAQGDRGAEGGTRTPTGYPTRPSNVRVCQFRHFGAGRILPPPLANCQGRGRDQTFPSDNPVSSGAGGSDAAIHPILVALGEREPSDISPTPQPKLEALEELVLELTDLKFQEQDGVRRASAR